MKRLFYVRHGETELNAAKRFGGRIDVPLNKTGIKQAAKTGQAVKAKLPTIDLIICSPYQRTRQTAQLIAKELNYPIEKIEINGLLIERSLGVLDGTLISNFLDHHEYSEVDGVEGAETVEAMQRRAQLAFDQISSLPATNILIVGHGAFGRAIRRVANNEPHTHEYKKMKPIDNASIIELV